MKSISFIIIALIPFLIWAAVPNDGTAVLIPSTSPQIIDSYIDYTESSCFFRYQPGVDQEALANAGDGYSQNMRYTGKCNSTPTWEDRGDRFVVVEAGTEMKVREYWTVHRSGDGWFERVLQAVSNKPYIKCCPLRERWANS